MIKITILLASHSSLAGGMEKQVALQAKELNKLDDVSITVITSSELGGLFDDSLDCRYLDMSKSRRNPVLLRQIYKALRDSSPDIIHAHGHKAANILSSLKPFLDSKARLVATSHGKKKKNSALKKMDAVIAVSKSLQEHLLPLRCHYIPNGIAPVAHEGNMDKSTLCAELTLEEHLPLIISVGRLAPVKRYDLLISACQNLPVNLLIIGDGPEREKLESISGSNVRFTGHRTDAREIMKIADLLVICSEREGFSLTLIEALLARLPVISTKVPGSIDILPERALVSDLDSAALKLKIEEALQTPQAFKENFSSAFEIAEKELTLKANLKKMDSFYRQLIQDTGNMSP